MVTRQFEENLAKFGLKRVKAVGEIFDPMVHEAIAQEETDEFEPGVVMKEFLAGYTLEDRLIRAAMVSVAKPPSKGRAPAVRSSDRRGMASYAQEGTRLDASV